MADHNDDLIDYEEDEEVHNDSTLVANGTSAAKDGDKEIKKGSYVGIHATGFRDFLLKPELLRAIVDCGFEHPSEGKGVFLFHIISIFFILSYLILEIGLKKINP